MHQLLSMCVPRSEYAATLKADPEGNYAGTNMILKMTHNELHGALQSSVGRYPYALFNVGNSLSPEPAGLLSVHEGSCRLMKQHSNPSFILKCQLVSTTKCTI